MGTYCDAYPVTVGVVERLELYNVRVSDNPHNLQFSILLPSVITFFTALESLTLNLLS